MVRFAGIFALAFGFLSLSVVGFAQDEKKGKGKGKDFLGDAFFKEIDANGDGKISKGEFKKSVMDELGKDGLKKSLPETADRLDKIFAAADTNKDGSLSFKELKAGFEKIHESVQDLFKKKAN